MNKSPIKTALLLLAITWLIPVAVLAQVNVAGTNAVAITTNMIPRPAPPIHRLPPIHGVVSAVDTNAMTLTIGNSTFSVSSKTKIAKANGAVKLSDINVGDYAVVVYIKGPDGSLQALGIRVTIHPPIKPRQPTDSTTTAPTAPAKPASPATQ